MTLLRALVLGVGLLAATAAVADEKKKADGPKIVGKWKVADGQKAGDKIGDDAKKGEVTITKDTITLSDGKETFEFTYKLDATAKPAAIDMEITKPEGFKGAKAKGIVAVDGDTLKLCYHPMGGERPKKFESTKEDGQYLMTLKKAEKKEEKKGDK